MRLKNNQLLLFVVIFSICIINCDGRGVNGGLSCAVCTVVTGLIQGEAYLKGVSIYNAARNLCKKLPIKIQQPCYATVEKLAPFLMDKQVLDLFTPDAFCYASRSCHIPEGGSFCHLFPLPHTSFLKTHLRLSDKMNEYGIHDLLQTINKHELKDGTDNNDVNSEFYRQKLNPYKIDDRVSFDYCDLPLFKEVCDVFSGTFEDLLPAVDLDKDGFSIINSARGSNWRGKDCNDVVSNIYPGAQTHFLDSKLDSDCNGISGVDAETGRPWEDILCGGTNSKGLIYIGDSVGAHFHFPEVWMNPNKQSKSSFGTILDTLLNSMDWPELGFVSGYENSTHPDLIQGTTDSIYLRLREHNRCMHRDYQNMAQNGANSTCAMPQVNAISRIPSDKPAILIYGMMGNDVCNRFKDTINNMTTPKTFHDKVMEVLRALDRKLPRYSHVVLISLVDASFIYPAMANRIHPLGSVLNNIRYEDMYSWFNCMQIGPCTGWMNSNATLRNITTQKAAELSLILKDIAKNSSFESFKVHYLQNPFNVILKSWVDAGGQVYELIDNIDSLHPNQLAQPLIAAELWESLKNIGVLGDENPHNQKIIELFGEQGGH